MKKILSALLICTMVLSLGIVTFAAADVNEEFDYTNNTPLKEVTFTSGITYKGDGYWEKGHRIIVNENGENYVDLLQAFDVAPTKNRDANAYLDLSALNMTEGTYEIELRTNCVTNNYKEIQIMGIKEDDSQEKGMVYIVSRNDMKYILSDSTLGGYTKPVYETNKFYTHKFVIDIDNDTYKYYFENNLVAENNNSLRNGFKTNKITKIKFMLQMPANSDLLQNNIQIDSLKIKKAVEKPVEPVSMSFNDVPENTSLTNLGWAVNGGAGKGLTKIDPMNKSNMVLQLTNTNLYQPYVSLSSFNHKTKTTYVDFRIKPEIESGDGQIRILNKSDNQMYVLTVQANRIVNTNPWKTVAVTGNEWFHVRIAISDVNNKVDVFINDMENVWISKDVSNPGDLGKFNPNFTSGCKGSFLIDNLHIYHEDNAPVFAPVADKTGGELQHDEYVTLTSATPGAKIYYTLNGENPTTESLLYEVSFPVAKNNTVVKAIAVSGDKTSFVESFGPYTVKKAPDGSVSMTFDNEEIDSTLINVGWKTNGGSGSGSVKADINDNYNKTLMIQNKNGYQPYVDISNSHAEVIEFSFLPKFLNKDGQIRILNGEGAQMFTLTVRNTDIVNTDPWTTYNFEQDKWIKMKMVVAPDKSNMDIYINDMDKVWSNKKAQSTGELSKFLINFTGASESSYYIDDFYAYDSTNAPLYIPTSDVKGGELSYGSLITLTNPNAEGEIYYTVDGSMPDETSLKYTAPIAITENNMMIKAVCVKGDKQSQVKPFGPYTLKNVRGVVAKKYTMTVDGKEIADASLLTPGKTLKTVCEINNIDKEAKTVTLIVGLYKNDILKGVSFKKYENITGNSSLETEIVIPNESGMKARVYLWDTIDNGRVYGEVKEF